MRQWGIRGILGEPRDLGMPGGGLGIPGDLGSQGNLGCLAGFGAPEGLGLPGALAGREVWGGQLGR